MNFGEVLTGLTTGIQFYREGWNGIGQCIALQTPDENSKMTQPYIYFERATDDGEVIRIPWVASQADLLAQDWAIYES